MNYTTQKLLDLAEANKIKFRVKKPYLIVLTAAELILQPGSELQISSPHIWTYRVKDVSLWCNFRDRDTFNEFVEVVEL